MTDRGAEQPQRTRLRQRGGPRRGGEVRVFSIAAPTIQGLVDVSRSRSASTCKTATSPTTRCIRAGKSVRRSKGSLIRRPSPTGPSCASSTARSSSCASAKRHRCTGRETGPAHGLRRKVRDRAERKGDRVLVHGASNHTPEGGGSVGDVLSPSRDTAARGL